MFASPRHWCLLVGTILVLMAAGWLAPQWLTPPRLQENRVLASAPAWPRRVSEFAAYRKSADAYVADRFPARPYLIAILNRLRMMVGVSGSSRVIVGRDGWLFFDDGTHLGAARGDPAMTGTEVRDWLKTLAGRTAWLRARGVPYLVVTAPVKEIIYPQYGPAWYAGPSRFRSVVTLTRLAHESGAGDTLYLQDAIAQATRPERATYSRHDTHWNGYGAYAGYAALMRRLQGLGAADGPLPLSAFQMTRGDEAGRPRDLALMLGVASFVRLDFPHIMDPAGEGRAHITYLSAKTNWTGPQVIDTGATGKPVLLMTRDSFSNELLPLLYPHFSRIVLAHNDDGTWRPDLIERFKPDIVVLEAVEHGLRVSMKQGPDPSAEAVARIDNTLATADLGARAPLLPTLQAPDMQQAAAIAAARPAIGCHFEVASLTPGQDGAMTFAGSGWISELTPKVTSPMGFVTLTGPGGVLAGPVTANLARPDVAAAFQNPGGRLSGFVGTYFAPRLAPGAYAPAVYRRAGAGWITCKGDQVLTAP